MPFFCNCYLHIFRVRNVCTSAHVRRMLAYAPISVHGMRCYANARISGELMCVRYCRSPHIPWVRLLLSRRVLGLFEWHLVALQQLLISPYKIATDLRAKQCFLCAILLLANWGNLHLMGLLITLTLISTSC